MKGVIILMYQPQFWPITMCLEIGELDILGGSIPVEPLKWRYKNPTVAIASNTIALNEMGCLWVRHLDPGVMQDFGKFSDPKTKSDYSDPRNVGIYMLISNVEICPDKEIQITMGLGTNLLILWVSVLRIESWVHPPIKQPGGLFIPDINDETIKINLVWWMIFIGCTTAGFRWRCNKGPKSIKNKTHISHSSIHLNP